MVSVDVKHHVFFKHFNLALVVTRMSRTVLDFWTNHKIFSPPPPTTASLPPLPPLSLLLQLLAHVCVSHVLSGFVVCCKSITCR